jgi:copper chaperone CopZ
MFRYAFLDFLMDISKWLLIGLVIAALVAVILPDDFFTRYIGNDYLSMLLVLAASVPMYVCATGSVPIAAVLLMKGLSPGAAMVFLMAGPATNAATMTVIGNALGKRTLFVYMASIIGGALFFGTLVNELLPASWFQIAQSSHIHHHHEGHFLPHWFSLLSAIALIAMLANGYILRYYPNFYAFAQKKENTSTFSTQLSQRMEPIKIQVNGMTCNHCKASVEKNVGALAGIQEVKVELAEASVVLTGEGIDLDAVRQKVEDIGFEYVGPVAG